MDSWVRAYALNPAPAIRGEVHALARGHLHPFVESLWSGVELMAKGELLMTHGTELAGKAGKNHKAIQDKYDLVKTWGGVEERFADLYGQLQDLRKPARYLERKLDLTVERAREMLSDARDMHRALEAQAPTRELQGVPASVVMLEADRSA